MVISVGTHISTLPGVRWCLLIVPRTDTPSTNTNIIAFAFAAQRMSGFSNLPLPLFLLPIKQNDAHAYGIIVIPITAPLYFPNLPKRKC